MVDTKAKPKPIPKNSSTTSHTSKAASGSDNCIVASETEIEGNFFSKQNFRLDGTIIGHLKCENRFVMGENGRIESTVRTKDAEIIGIIEGDILAQDSLHLKKPANIKGNITARRLIVEEGARYLGMRKTGVKEKFMNRVNL